MTPEQFSEQLPQFASDELAVAPPLVFRRVSARIFPLRANLDILQQLCNSYLNIIPVEAGYFRAPFPYVLLVVLDYGQMGAQVTTAGWFSQVEVYFGVVVEWYKCVQGEWVFQDWGVITPYIFVNDFVSVPVGRTVYGYPKILSTVELTQSQWIKNPLAPTTLARISTKVFPEVFIGGQLESRVFLEVETATLSNLRLPFDATSPTMPWTIASNLADAFGGFGRDAWWLAQGMRICPSIPSSGGPQLFPAMLTRLMRGFMPGQNGFVLNAFNLKQFRREEAPSEICYRALTNNPIEVTAFNGSGLLGENRILLGDLSGGYSISLYEHGSLPIAQTLGLEVYSTWTSGGVQVAEFKPVMPNWIDVDLKCDRGINLAWQARDGVWKNEAGEVFYGQPELNLAFNTTASTAIEAISGPFRFDEATVHVIPLLAKTKTLQEFLERGYNQPLRAPIVDEHGCEVKDRIHFEVWAPGSQSQISEDSKKFAYVYLVASSFTRVLSEANNVGDWAKDELSFLIPVKLQRKRIQNETPCGAVGAPVHEKDDWETVGVGLVPAVTMVDNDITAFTRLEIQGIEATTAEFIPPPNAWLGEHGPVHPKQALLQVKMEILPAVGEGQSAKLEPVIEISQDDWDHGLGNVSQVKSRWADDLKSELERKKVVKRDCSAQLKIARALSIELLGSEQSFSLYTLKQFRDANDASKACYQALVRVPRKLSEVSDVCEIEKTLTVRIYGYPHLDIVKDLGLDAMPLDNRAAGIVYSMQGFRPFYIRADIYEPHAECLLSRSGTSQWTMHPALFETMLLDNNNESDDRIIVDLGAEEIQDLADPSHPAAARVQSRHQPETRKRAAKNLEETKRITMAAGYTQLSSEDTINVARAAIDVVDPQVVIESILSREWSNFDPKARWRAGRDALIQAFRLLPVDGTLKPYAEAELYRKTNNELATSLFGVAVGAVASEISLQYMDGKSDVPGLVGPDPSWAEDVKTIIERQKDFTTRGDQLERLVDKLSPLFILRIDGVNERIKKAGQSPITPLRISRFIDNAIKRIQEIKGIKIPDGQADVLDRRLEEVLQQLKAKRAWEARTNPNATARLENERAHEPEIAELVDLTRQKRRLHLDILLNKLAKAYQKPDFCILRDAFPAKDQNSLLPRIESWDEHWYYGE
jgi:hypothetical protein